MVFEVGLEHLIANIIKFLFVVAECGVDIQSSRLVGPMLQNKLLVDIDRVIVVASKVVDACHAQLIVDIVSHLVVVGHNCIFVVFLLRNMVEESCLELGFGSLVSLSSCLFVVSEGVVAAGFE